MAYGGLLQSREEKVQNAHEKLSPSCSTASGDFPS